MAAEPVTGTPVGGAKATTRARMIDVAERLFAEHGVEAVSLRTVGTSAGQRNNSVAQYHFGSKEGLIAAIIAARSTRIDARRQELAAELQATGEPLSPAALLQLLVRPLAETIGTSTDATFYVRFLAKVMDDPTFVNSAEGSDTDQPALRWMRRKLRALLPHQSTRTFRRRNHWSVLIALRVLAEHERQVAAGNKQAPPTDVVVQELVTTITALMTAADEGNGRVPP